LFRKTRTLYVLLPRIASSSLIVLLAVLPQGCQRADAVPPIAASAVAPSFTIPDAHPRILLADEATKARLKKLLATRSPAAIRFEEQVTGQVMGRNAYAFQPWYAALMFQLTGQERYADYAITQTDAYVASEEARISKGEAASVAGDSYLEVGTFIGNVALVYDWCYPKLTAAQRSRWIAHSNNAVANVWNHTGATWGNTKFAWTGWSVDNPSNNYYYSFLRATMLVGLATNGENAAAPRWIQMFRTSKLENQLFPTFNRDLQGGGSREGTGYGTAMKSLWQLYDWWEHSTGERISDRTPHTLASMAHLMHSIVPTLDRLAPTGDHARDSTAALFDYHREYLLELQTLFPNERLSGVARTLLESSSVPTMKSPFMYFADFLYEQPDIPRRPLSDLSTAYYGSGTGQFAMRSSWDKAATYANFICGPYTESHAHRDQGSFVLFKGSWLATDSNMYSHSGIEQEESLHNLVRFENAGETIKQAYGTTCHLMALANTPEYAYAAARVTPNYRGNPAVTKSERDVLFIKPDTVVVFDRAASRAGIRRVWTLNLPGAPTVNGEALSYVDGRNRLDVQRLSPTGLTSEVRAWPDLKKEMRAGARVDVADTSTGPSAFLHVLSVNGAVIATSRSDGQDQTGAMIKFADGRVATVRFSTQGSGGWLELRGVDQNVQFTGALPTTVNPPPLFVN